jgi:hypothetical protein
VRRTTISFIKSARPSVSTEEFGFQKTDFREILYWEGLVKRNGQKEFKFKSVIFLFKEI